MGTYNFKRLNLILTTLGIVSTMSIGFSTWLITGNDVVTATTMNIFTEPVVATVYRLFSYDSTNSVNLIYISESFWKDSSPSFKGSLTSAFTAVDVVTSGKVFNYKITFTPKTGYTPSISLTDGSLIPVPTYQITAPINSNTSSTSASTALGTDGALSYTIANSMAANQQLKIAVTFDASFQKNASTGNYTDDLDFTATIYPFLQNTTIEIDASWN
ncbi:MAG: hypothetical protein LKJ88_02100 [Bacilli bacterium]|jgi:hypothetical protein|nr:hypothetical protein [Bacilli bacterium]